MIVVFDTETTGVDVEEDRIVTAFLGVMDESGSIVDGTEWLIDPGIDIPKGASDVHGITTEYAIEYGLDAIEGIASLVEEFEKVSRTAPVVIYNAPFDLTILDRESRRYLNKPLNLEGVTIVDPLVIDKARDPYRKGKRTLTATAPVYGVPADEDAHNALADCGMAGRIALKMLEDDTAQSYHRKSVAWKREQAESLQKYLRKTNPDATVDPQWPIRTKENNE